MKHAESPEVRLSRRSFLQRTTFAGAAVVAPLVVPASVLGRGGAASPANRIGIGMIGLGRQATHANLPGLMNQPDTQIVALCDVDAWRMGEALKAVEQHYAAKSGQAAWHGCATTGDFREVLARADVDAVMISTPDHWHVPMAVRAIKAGKDVCCEKPLTRSVHEGRVLSDLVRRERRVFRTDSEFRSGAKFLQAVHIVRNGKIGRLQTIRVQLPPDTGGVGQPAPMPVPPELDYDLWLGPAPQAPYTLHRVHEPRQTKGRPGWLRIREYADGMLANWGAHFNDIVQWANDTERTGPVDVLATAKFPPGDELWNVFLEFSAEFTYANGVKLLCKTGKPQVRFEGSAGYFEVQYPNDLDAQPESLLTWKPGANDRSWPLVNEKRDFLDAVKSRGQTMEDAEVGHRVTSLAHIANVSIALGRKLRWDAAKEQFIGDDEANRLLLPKPPRGPWTI